jgi:hypothetical protein
VDKEDDKDVRDLHMLTSDELISKILAQDTRMIYDKQYLRDLVNSFSNQLLPITKERYVYSFQGYSKAFKAYTEDKYYT